MSASRSGSGRRRAAWVRAFGGRLLLLLASLVVCLGLVEAFLRFSMDRRPELGLAEFDFELGSRMKPGFRGQRHYGVPVEINSHGMRDREFAHAKSAGTFRAIALGDSWTAGLGVHAHETWPKRVEALLAGPLGRVEVLNTGVSGYETYNEAQYYRRDLVAFEHDLVLVGMYPVNDVHNKKRRYARRKALYDIHPWLLDAYLYPRRHLYLHHWWKNLRKQRKLARRREAYAKRAVSAGPAETGAALFPRAKDDWTRLYTPEYRGFRLMQEALDTIGATAREAGARGVVALFPDLRDLTRYREYAHGRVEPLIREAVEAAGLELVDLAADFAPYERRETEIALGGKVGASHPNAAGHELIARGIVRELAARGLLPQPR